MAATPTRTRSSGEPLFGMLLGIHVQLYDLRAYVSRHTVHVWVMLRDTENLVVLVVISYTVRSHGTAHRSTSYQHNMDMVKVNRLSVVLPRWPLRHSYAPPAPRNSQVS